MPQFGGKPKKSSSISKRHFKVVIGDKEHGLYISSTPSSAARKAVTKLCTANKSKKVEFYMREITQDSKKKTYGPYEGHIEKLKNPIDLKGRVIKYKPVAKLSGKTSSKSSVKKGGMRGGNKELLKKGPYPHFIIETVADLRRGYPFDPKILVRDLDRAKEYLKNVKSRASQNSIQNLLGEYKEDNELFDEKVSILQASSNRKEQPFKFRDDISEDKIQKFLKDETKKERILKKFEELQIPHTVKIFLKIPYRVDGEEFFESILYLVYIPSGNIAVDSSNNPVNKINYSTLNDMRNKRINKLREFEIYTKQKFPELSQTNKEKLRKDYEKFIKEPLKKSSFFNFSSKETNEEISERLFTPINALMPRM